MPKKTNNCADAAAFSHDGENNVERNTTAKPGAFMRTCATLAAIAALNGMFAHGRDATA